MNRSDSDPPHAVAFDLSQPAADSWPAHDQGSVAPANALEH